MNFTETNGENVYRSVMSLLLYLAETRKDGYYSAGEVLFISQTNNVDVKFTSDSSVTATGVTMNIRSISCADRDNFSQTDMGHHSTHSPEHPGETPDSCDEQRTEITAGEVLTGALAINTGNDGNYPNNACQQWNVIADENHVNIFFSKGTTLFSSFNVVIISIWT